MDERNMLPLVRERAILMDKAPAMRWDGKENFKEWQKRAKAKLEAYLGGPYEKCDDLIEIEDTVDHEKSTEIVFSFQSEPGYFIPCHLLLPKGVENPPVMVCLQGHGRGQHITLGIKLYEGDDHSLEGGRDFAVQCIDRGIAALTMDQRCFGKCGGKPEPDCHIASMTALMLGRTMIGARVWDVSRAIDLLENHFADKVDTSRVCCMGNSGGGTATFYAACMDERIRFAVPSCAVCSYWASICAVHHCVCNFIPGIARDFDMGDLAGLIAPRPLVLVCGKEEKSFPLYGVVECYELAKKAYTALGAENDVRHVIGNMGHQFYPDDAWPVMAELMKKI